MYSVIGVLSLGKWLFKILSSSIIYIVEHTPGHYIPIFPYYIAVRHTDGGISYFRIPGTHPRCFVSDGTPVSQRWFRLSVRMGRECPRFDQHCPCRWGASVPELIHNFPFSMFLRVHFTSFPFPSTNNLFLRTPCGFFRHSYVILF